MGISKTEVGKMGVGKLGTSHLHIMSNLIRIFAVYYNDFSGSIDSLCNLGRLIRPHNCIFQTKSLPLAHTDRHLYGKMKLYISLHSE